MNYLLEANGARTAGVDRIEGKWVVKGARLIQSAQDKSSSGIAASVWLCQGAINALESMKYL